MRQLRVANRLTQTELAGDRFSKEYVSQIERSKTRPTRETLEWLAERLGVDASFLETGVSADERAQVEAGLARAEALAVDHRYREAADAFASVSGSVKGLAVPELYVRALTGEARGRMNAGEVREAMTLLDEARRVAETPTFSDVERAEILFLIGACRYMLSSVETAIGLLNEALRLAEQSGLPSDKLRANIFDWRSRCYRRRRDFEAAREDVERALELSEALNDHRTIAQSYFQASLIAERQGRWVLARSYAEKAKTHFEELADRLTVGRLLNNLGAFNFQLGKPAEAVSLLKQAVDVALEVGSDVDAGQAISSLAQVHLRTGEVELAEKHARHALRLLEGRVDFVYEIGNAQLVLGRALLEQNRLDQAGEVLRAAEASFEQIESISHRAAAWVAQGDLAARRGEHHAAARLYRRAAEALQDFHF